MTDVENVITLLFTKQRWTCLGHQISSQQLSLASEIFPLRRSPVQCPGSNSALARGAARLIRTITTGKSSWNLASCRADLALSIQLKAGEEGHVAHHSPVLCISAIDRVI